MHTRWWEGLEKLEATLLAEDTGASFRSPLGILTHMANVEQAWMDVVEDSPPQWARHSTKKWDTLAPVKAYVEESRVRTHGIIGVMSEEDLARDHPAVGPFAKQAFSAEEILFTIITHECFHRGELLALLWQKDVEPPVCDYPAYATPLR